MLRPGVSIKRPTPALRTSPRACRLQLGNASGMRAIKPLPFRCFLVDIRTRLQGKAPVAGFDHIPNRLRHLPGAGPYNEVEKASAMGRAL